MRCSMLTGFWFLVFAGIALGQIPSGSALDCANAPSNSAGTGNPKDQLGRVSFLLFGCFEEIELQLNNIMQPGPAPNREIDIALIQLHKQVTEKTATDLRRAILVLVRGGSEENKATLAHFEADVLQSMTLIEASLINRALLAAPQEKGSQDKGKEVQESIKKIIKELVDNKFTPSYIGKSFEIIDELVRLFVKT